MRRLTTAVISAALAMGAFGALPASAEVSLKSVKDTISNPAPGATSVTHTILFTNVTAIGAAAGNKVTIDFNTNGPFTGANCGNVTPSGFPGTTGCSVATNVVTVTFDGALSANTALTVTITGMTNPNPGSSTSYKIPIKTYAGGGVTLTDSAAAMVNIQNSLTVQLNVASDLYFTVVQSPVGDTMTFDLDPTTTVRDTDNTTTLTIKTNAKNGYTVTAIANHQLEHSAYSGTFVTNNFGGTSTVGATWSNGEIGFGYSLDGGTNYLIFDTATARTVKTSANPTSASGDTQVLNYRAEIDYSVPAGIYTMTVTFVATPNY